EKARAGRSPCDLEISREKKAVTFHDGPAFRPVEELNEGQTEVRARAPLDHGRHLVEWLVELRIDRHVAHGRNDGHGQRHDAGFHRARLDELERVADVLAVDELGLHAVPPASALESLL